MSGRECWCACLCALITLVTCAPDNQAAWIHSQPQQTLHGLMVSIDERLHTLENARWESTLKQIEQRLDSMETSIRRLDTSFQDRVDKVERNLNSRELKDELMVEKLSHKLRDVLDSSYDRYNRRLGYTEERLELSFKKVQMSVEGSLNKIDKQQEDIQTEVLEAVTILEDLKNQIITEGKLNSTNMAFQQSIQTLISPNFDELQRISVSLEHLSSRLNSSMGSWGSQNDGPQVGDVLTTIRKEINTEGSKFTNKVNNMYNDLWRRIASVESLIKDMSRLGNMTQREVLQEVRSLVLNDRRDFPGDSQENFIEVALDALERKLQRKLLDLGRKLDDRLDTLSATQNLVMDSCFDGGICRGLESRLSQVLEKIFEVFSEKIEGFSNRTYDIDDTVMEMMELVKMQHSQLIRTITHNTNMVVTLAKDSSDANKMMHTSITQLAEQTKYTLQELHEDIQETNNTSDKICADKIIEENNDKQIPKNNTEVRVVTLNLPRANENMTNERDAGILKITTENDEVLSDNFTLVGSAPIELTLNTTQEADATIMQIINMISPNMTQSKLNSLLKLINNSMQFDHLEAIIQNTEAKADDDVVPYVEIYGLETRNKSDSDSYFNGVSDKDLESSQLSELFDEAEIDSEEVEDFNQSEIKNLTIGHEDEPVNTGVSTEDKEQSKMSADLLDNVKIYALLFKIKHAKLNMSGLWEQIEKSSNHSEDQTTHSSLHVLQQLCYGEASIDDLTTVNNAMRNRLILINQTISDVDLYEKIETICNTMTEALQSKTITEDNTTEDYAVF